jgi:thiamine-phosphate pyrophosphorylase
VSLLSSEVTRPRLIVFSDATRVSVADMLARFSALALRARAQSVLFCVRDYALPTRARWALALELRSMTERTQQLFGVAERADWALALGARALHLPEAGLDPTDARGYLGPSVFLSRACHDPLSFADPSLNGLVLSPIFEPRKGRPALGIRALSDATEVNRRSEVGLYALGAVSADNAAQCLAAGSTGVAVIGAALAPLSHALLDALQIACDPRPSIARPVE